MLFDGFCFRFRFWFAVIGFVRVTGLWVLVQIVCLGLFCGLSVVDCGFVD